MRLGSIIPNDWVLRFGDERRHYRSGQISPYLSRILCQLVKDLCFTIVCMAAFIGIPFAFNLFYTSGRHPPCKWIPMPTESNIKRPLH